MERETERERETETERVRSSAPLSLSVSVSLSLSVSLPLRLNSGQLNNNFYFARINSNDWSTCCSLLTLFYSPGSSPK
jgi:hypothetical protein